MSIQIRFRKVVGSLLLVVALIGSIVVMAGGQSPSGGFVADGGALNANPHAGSEPSIALGSLTPGGDMQPWVAFIEDGQAVVSSFNKSSNLWERRGTTLNAQAGSTASGPVIAFAGADQTTPWATFADMVGGKGQIRAAHFDGSSWQLSGSGMPPTLNHDPAQDAARPSLAAGTTTAGELLEPWVAWDEAAGTNRQVFVSHATGSAWQPIEQPATANSQRSSLAPDITFSGSGSTTPWIVWQETGGEGVARVFAAQAVSDSAALGGYRWSKIGSQANCNDELTCALNRDANADATQIRVASGALPGEPAPSPWVVFVERMPTGARQVYVRRLDSGRFRLVGDSLNVDPTQNASDPDIFFVGNVPHVTWVENQDGVPRLFVRHLGDARPGQERWDLDALAPNQRGDELASLNRQLNQPASQPALSSNGSTPYIAWQEGGPSSIFADHRYPEGPAWGSNRPPFIRVISGTRALIQSFVDPGLRQSGGSTELPGRDAPLTVTTSCDHVNGWDNITEIQFELRSTTNGQRIFLGRYVAADNTVLVENPDNSGTFLSGTPGTGQNIDTKYVTLFMPQTTIEEHGPSSPALDIHWALVFKQTVAGDYVQSINIIYKAPTQQMAGEHSSSLQQTTMKSTDFFEVGRVSTGYKVTLPLIVR